MFFFVVFLLLFFFLRGGGGEGGPNMSIFCFFFEHACSFFLCVNMS